MLVLMGSWNEQVELYDQFPTLKGTNNYCKLMVPELKDGYALGDAYVLDAIDGD